MTTLQAALKYADLNLSIIPVGNDKKPLVPWGIYQKRKATQDEIKKWFEQFNNPNIGIVTGEISNLLVIDCDSQEAIDQIEEMLPENIEIPASSTPRGGRHYYFQHIEGFPNKANLLKSIDIRTSGGFIIAPPSVNGNGKIYTWINNNGLSEVPAPILHGSLLNLLKNANIKDKNTYILDHIANDVPRIGLFQKGRRDEDLFHFAHQLAKSKTSQQEIREVLEILAKNCNPPFPEKELYIKIESAIKYSADKQRNLASEIREWVCLQEGTFCLRNIYDALQLSTRDEKKNVSIILKRLSEGDNKLIIKTVGVAGSYKTVTNTAKVIDLSDRSDLKGELPISFPFGIENYIKAMPGCVYIIAGETDTGKSAFLMNFAKRNTGFNNVHYFSSEMGKQELFDRTDHFWPNIGDDKNFTFYEDCYEDFDQLIKPDDVNIIDYLELFDNFYLMASIIDKIGRALRNGIVFIALQKPKNRDEGTGGERTKNLARLYLALSPGVLKIVKAKNWRDAKINPNGLSIPFKLAEGCKFYNTDPWKKA